MDKKPVGYGVSKDGLYLYFDDQSCKKMAEFTRGGRKLFLKYVGSLEYRDYKPSVVEEERISLNVWGRFGYE